MKPRRFLGRRGFTRQPENSKTCTFEALQTPPKFHEKPPREREKELKIVTGEGKKARNFGPPTLRGSTLRTPPVASPLHFLLGFWVHPSGSTFRGPPFGAHPANKHVNNARKRSKKPKQLTKKLKQLTLSKNKTFSNN